MSELGLCAILANNLNGEHMALVKFTKVASYWLA